MAVAVRSAMMTKRTRNNAVLARKNKLSVRRNAKRNVAANASGTEEKGHRIT